MTSTKPQKLWLPYLVALLGGLLTFLLAYLFWLDAQANDVVMNALEVYLPWLTLLFGATISLLLAMMTRVAQLAKQRAVTVDKINNDLKREISERIQAEETRQKLEIALLQGHKLQAMGTLASGIAHDFNNLLYAIIGYVEMARDDVEKGTLVHGNLGKVLEASHRGQELISRILSFSRRQHQHFAKMNLNDTIEAVLCLLIPTIPASVAIEFKAENTTFIIGNQNQIHQVFVNIINNAIDAMNGEGIIQIILSSITTDDPLLSQFPDTQHHRRNYCKIEIKDNGQGMDQVVLERVFEPFYTTKEVGKGTGLGLSIVHSIVKDHHGVIRVESQKGQGTTFMILLPEQ